MPPSGRFLIFHNSVAPPINSIALLFTGTMLGAHYYYGAPCWINERRPESRLSLEFKDFNILQCHDLHGTSSAAVAIGPEFFRRIFADRDRLIIFPDHGVLPEAFFPIKGLRNRLLQGCQLLLSLVRWDGFARNIHLQASFIISW